ncbi:hypothetical protein NEF87_001903 [Candidatus Lokiarchaeum ossiferum]|uniref:GTP-binding protein n=1 Tax=Candidatus Lokiarchaeum ossiferum TaxID=2951803 RepID=A0ABY6HQJ1_9ARCH|nr:hypothetical protein NEF87_001903 [Candidatus Lokiarchaeum sp. B-35]
MMIKSLKPIYKTILAGDGGVGKTSLLKSKLAGKFTPEEKLTIGIDFDCYNIVSEPKDVSILVYDLGGQERFQFIHKAFILGAKAAIILYDLTRISTLYHIPSWISLLQTEYPSIPILIVGSKKDLVNDDMLRTNISEWEVLKETLPKSANIIGHMTISAKHEKDCIDVFGEIKKLAIKWKEQSNVNNSGGIKTKQL